MSPLTQGSIMLFCHNLFVISIAVVNRLNPLEFLGLNCALVATAYLGKTILVTLYTFFFARIVGHNVDLRTLGSWAVVTGATDGIGLAYCVELAKRGINIVLMSRSIEKLNTCASNLEKRFSIKTIVIEMDFSKEVEKYEKILPQLQELEIGTLINNVGMTYPRPTRFDEIFYKQNFVRDIINLNVLAVTMMTGAVLPGMVERGKGAIINVGSMYSCFGGPYFALYSSTKSYMQRLTSDLAEEFKETGVIFQYQCPGYVATKMSKFKSSLTIPTPEEYAAAGIKMVGLTEITSVWMIHGVFRKMFAITSLWIPDIFVRGFYTEFMRQFWLFAKKKEFERLKEAVSDKISEVE